MSADISSAPSSGPTAVGGVGEGPPPLPLDLRGRLGGAGGQLLEQPVPLPLRRRPESGQPARLGRDGGDPHDVAGVVGQRLDVARRRQSLRRGDHLGLRQAARGHHRPQQVGRVPVLGAVHEAGDGPQHRQVPGEPGVGQRLVRRCGHGPSLRPVGRPSCRVPPRACEWRGQGGPLQSRAPVDSGRTARILSPGPVRNNASNVLAKLQVTDRAQAIVQAREAGLGR